MIRIRRWHSLFLVALLAAACRPGPRDLSMKFLTEDMELRVLPDPVPPRAREPVRYKIVISDKETGEPIESGQGQIFATSESNIDAFDPLVKGPEIGRIRHDAFHNGGQWAMAIGPARSTRNSNAWMMKEVFPLAVRQGE